MRGILPNPPWARGRAVVCLSRPGDIGRSGRVSPNPAGLTSPRAGWRSQCPAAPRQRRRPAPRGRPARAAASWSRRPPAGPRRRSWGAGSGEHQRPGGWRCGRGVGAPRQDAGPRRPPVPGRSWTPAAAACRAPRRVPAAADCAQRAGGLGIESEGPNSPRPLSGLRPLAPSVNRTGPGDPPPPSRGHHAVPWCLRPAETGPWRLLLPFRVIFPKTDLKRGKKLSLRKRNWKCIFQINIL